MKESTSTINNYGNIVNIDWLRKLGAAGFAFFLIKGLVWIIAAAWFVY